MVRTDPPIPPTKAMRGNREVRHASFDQSSSHPDRAETDLSCDPFSGRQDPAQRRCDWPRATTTGAAGEPCSPAP
jgi:hypothetical protein